MRSPTALVALLFASSLAGACASSLAPASDRGTSNPPPSSSPRASLDSASPSGTSTPASSPARSAAAEPPPTAVTVPGVVTTLATDGLRVRSEPRVSDDSRKLQPLLPLGSHLYVLGGPVSASGYEWYEVVPLLSDDLPSGWVASGDRDGQPWIVTDDFACPPLPTDLRSLAALSPGVGLACFRRVPITVTARLIECNCDMDGPGYTPSWFLLGSGSPDLLVAPDVTAVPTDAGNWFVLNLDPKAERPKELPIGRIVEATGIFDHPAASSCTRTEMDGEPVPDHGCRLLFAVTRLVTRVGT
jgi:hypothetical protein